MWVNSAKEDRGKPATQVRTAPKADANSSRWYLSQRAMRRHFCRTDVTEYLVEMGRSLQLNARELDHLGPFLGVFGDKPAEIGWRAYKRCAP